MGLFSSAPASHFPIVKGRRLDGADVRYPQDLPADATLLILMFEDGLDPLADQWARLGDRIAEAHDGRFATLEMPVVGRKMKLLGELGTLGIRGQIDSDEERERTVPIFVDTTVFRKALKLDKRDVTALLVARDGRIAWRGEGDIDMDEIGALEAAIQDVLAGPIPAPSDHPDLAAEDDPTDDEEDGPETDNDADPEAAADDAPEADEATRTE